MTEPLRADIDTLVTICTGCITDDLLDLYQGYCDIFYEVGFVGHLVELDYIEMRLNAHEITHDEAVAQVTECLLIAAEECLNVLGIEVDPDTPIPLIHTLMEAIVTFDVTEYPQTMLDIVEGTEDPIEFTAALLDFLTVEGEEVWYNHLENVESAFVENVRAVLVEAIESVPEEFLTIDVDFNRRRKLALTVFPSVTLINEVCAPTYLSELLETYTDRLTELDEATYIKTVVGLASVASDPPEALTDAVDAIIDEYLQDPGKRLQHNTMIQGLKQDLAHVIYR